MDIRKPPPRLIPQARRHVEAQLPKPFTGLSEPARPC
jgi:hypothetical protein